MSSKAQAIRGTGRPFIRAATVAVLLISAAMGQPPRPALLDCTPATHGALAIKGDDISRYINGAPAGFRGFADPCLRRDPTDGSIWMAYSWPHMQHMGGGPLDYAIGVETHLARSRDGGTTWQRVAVLWPKTPAKYTDQKTRVALSGFESHEVPNILPCPIDGKPAWVGVRMDYFLARQGNYKARDNRSFCLRLMAAPTPAQLAEANFITFGHRFTSPDGRMDINLCDYSKDFPLSFIPNEPALHYRDGRLYLAFVCMTFRGATPAMAESFIAVFSTQPAGQVKTWKWKYHGKLCDADEAKELGGEALTQIELATSKDGQLLALLTPEAWDPKAAEGFGDAFGGILHRGCVVVQVASLDQPALARHADGTLAVRARITSSTQPHQGPGAAGYDPASATGVLFTLRDLAAGQSLSWSIHPTRLHP